MLTWPYRADPRARGLDAQVQGVLERYPDRLTAIRWLRARHGLAFVNARKYVEEIFRGERWWRVHVPPRQRGAYDRLRTLAHLGPVLVVRDQPAVNPPGWRLRARLERLRRAVWPRASVGAITRQLQRQGLLVRNRHGKLVTPMKRNPYPVTPGKVLDSTKAARSVPPLTRWDTWGSGTGAPHGERYRHSYSFTFPGGRYLIDPIATRSGRFAYWLPTFLNEKGALPGGLWQQLRVSGTKTGALARVREHYASHFLPGIGESTTMKTNPVRRRARRNGPPDRAGARELFLHITNTGALYRGHAIPLMVRERFAVLDWKPLALEGARDYAREYGRGRDYWREIFDRATLEETARQLADYYRRHAAEAARAGRPIRDVQRNPARGRGDVYVTLASTAGRRWLARGSGRSVLQLSPRFADAVIFSLARGRRLRQAFARRYGGRWELLPA